MKIAIIPARGGSKRIPRKNIRPFMGKPIIQWSLEAAKESGIFEHIIVSTDDEEIAELARANGAEAPFLRPPELGNDHVSLDAVLKHALQYVIDNIERPSHVCTMFATAPFITASDIKAGHDLLMESDAEIVFTVTSFPFPIQRALKITEEGRVGMFYPEHLKSRSQDLEPAYHDAAQFYWSTTQSILDDVPAFSDQAIPLVLPRHVVQDIDTLEDWERAELMFDAWRRRGIDNGASA